MSSTSLDAGMPPRRGRSSGPLLKNGVDLFEADPAMWWFVMIMLTLFTLVFFFYIAIFINNIAIPHDYFKNPGMPGTLTSQRYGLNWVWLFLSVIAQGICLLLIFLMVYYRAYYGCHIVTFFLYFGLFVLMLIIMSYWAAQYSSANGDREKTNPFNDPKWCCVHFVDPYNECPNTIPCNPPVTQDQLHRNADMLWIFWVFVAVVILHFMYFIVMLVYWFSSPPFAGPRPEMQRREPVDAELRSLVYPPSSSLKTPVYEMKSTSPPQGLDIPWGGSTTSSSSPPGLRPGARKRK